MCVRLKYVESVQHDGDFTVYTFYLQCFIKLQFVNTTFEVPCDKFKLLVLINKCISNNYNISFESGRGNSPPLTSAHNRFSKMSYIDIARPAEKFRKPGQTYQQFKKF